MIRLPREDVYERYIQQQEEGKGLNRGTPKHLAISDVSISMVTHYFDESFLRIEEDYLGGKISPSFVELESLSYLDLSWNNFSGSTIPSFFGSMPSLRYLNLSSAYFEGLIPHQFGNSSTEIKSNYVWAEIEKGYKKPTVTKDGVTIEKEESEGTQAENNAQEGNTIALFTLFKSVIQSELARIAYLKIAKEAWDILQLTHEGTNEVKSSKIEVLVFQFENLKMEEDELL
ncbi:leucine-rich repeat protein FLOR 1-like [Cornus florida]|uniref:leucine-rich repeat protein FLOR 1-like n=1 Tax=Cornus florida TaxID=4283 RepID=UPI0028A11C8F|nr:leucine-rich repeat protein FLOR 1-like [Cornus florida]